MHYSPVLPDHPSSRADTKSSSWMYVVFPCLMWSLNNGQGGSTHTTLDSTLCGSNIFSKDFLNVIHKKGKWYRTFVDSTLLLVIVWDSCMHPKCLYKQQMLQIQEQPTEYQWHPLQSYCMDHYPPVSLLIYSLIVCSAGNSKEFESCVEPDISLLCGECCSRYAYSGGVGQRHIWQGSSFPSPQISLPAVNTTRNLVCSSFAAVWHINLIMIRK